LPSWWFSCKNCYFVGRFFDFVLILRPIAAATRWMTVRADSGVASILIPKTVQNGIRGLLHFSSPKKQFKTELGVASFLIPKSFHI
jgi:hypothetical protein